MGPVNVKAGKASATVKGSGGAAISLGSLTAGTSTCNLSGGSSADGMVADTMSISLFGGSWIETRVTKSVSGTCGGGGSVTVHGGGDTSGVSATSGCSVYNPRAEDIL